MSASYRTSDTAPRLTLPSIISSTASILSNSSDDAEQTKKAKARELVRDLGSQARGEIGNWWAAKKENSRDQGAYKTQQPSFRRSSSEGGPVSAISSSATSPSPYRTAGRPPPVERARILAPLPPPAPSTTTSFTPASASTPTLPSETPSVPFGREHLHYRDQAPRVVYPPITPLHQRRHSNPTLGESGSYKEDDEALSQALELSRREASRQSEKAKEADAELERALAESARLARIAARSPTTNATQSGEHAELSRAILESQRQALIESRGRPFSHPPPTFPSARTAPEEEAPPTLEESEWILQARNEKGEIWSEAGAHGWLPPGAGRPGGLEEGGEQKMLELAIRISLEEEQERLRLEEKRRAEAEAEDRFALPTRWGSGRRPLSSVSSPSLSPPARRKLSKRKPSITPPSPPPAPVSSLQRSPTFGGTAPLRPISTDLSTSPPPSSPIQSSTSPTRVGSDDLPLPIPPFARSNLSQGSPLEMPYLRPTRSNDLEEKQLDDYFQTNQQEPTSSESSAGLSSPNATSGAASSGTGTGSSSSHHNLSFFPPAPPPPRMDSPEALTIRNPDFSTSPSDNPPFIPVSESPTESYEQFNSQWAARSMSLISERTEPGSGSSQFASHGHQKERTAVEIFRELEDEKKAQEGLRENSGGSSRSGQVQEDNHATLSFDLPATPPHSPTPPTHSTFPLTAFPPPTRPLPPSPPLGDVEELEDLTQPPAATIEAPPTPSPPLTVTPEEPRIVFGDGVRFGNPAECAQNHVCAMDGLHSEAPFPSKIILSAFTDDDEEVDEEASQHGRSKLTFAVEASTWPSLLRFLMWYGETGILASPKDVANEETGHCDALMNLEFRKDDVGAGVVRLTITLLPPNHAPLPQTLKMLETPSQSFSGKGKGKAKSASSSSFSSIFALPDHPILPTRLSTIAVSLYSLRHLGEIALSTQPSKDAVPSYHALRTLALSLQALAKEHDQSSASDTVARARTQRDEERLLGRLRDRLKKMTIGGSGSNNGAKLVKVPPATQAERTHAVPRQERVLSSGDGDTAEVPQDLLRYLPTLAMR